MLEVAGGADVGNVECGGEAILCADLVEVDENCVRLSNKCR
jgi:hypothetical protein